MTICNDDQNITNIEPLGTDAASDGTLLPSFVSTAFENFSRRVSADISGPVTIISRYVNDFGQQSFDDGFAAVNSIILRQNTRQFPALENRFETGFPITQIEYANYMDEFLQTPDNITTLVNSNPNLVQSQLNDFYRNNFTDTAIGSFCSLMPQVFGAIDSFFDLVGDAQQAFQDITDFINNFSLEDALKKLTMKNLISKIKEQVQKIIDDTVNKIKKTVENVSFENTVGQIETYVNNNIISKFIELKAKALAFFSEENINTLKKKVENLFNYAAGIFKDPSLEEIEFLVYRFCKFASQVEQAINLVKKPLDDFVDDYRSAYNTIQTQSNIAVSDSIQTGGAIRYTNEERQSRINTAKEREQTQPSAPPADVTTEEWKDAESIATFEAVLNDSRFYIPVGSNNSWAREPIGQKLEDGWEMIYEKGNIELVARLIRLQKLFKKRLTITSAYRSELMQAKVNPGVRGYHIHAKALDIQWNGFTTTNREEFIDLAVNKCGFKGIGRYNSFVHIDIGPRREW